jgi:excisionase family DNA binding protein
MSDLMTVAEAANFAAISERTTRAMIRDGRMPSIRVGKRSVRLSRTALEKWLHEQPSAARYVQPAA